MDLEVTIWDSALLLFGNTSANWEGSNRVSNLQITSKRLLNISIRVKQDSIEKVAPDAASCQIVDFHETEVCVDPHPADRASVMFRPMRRTGMLGIHPNRDQLATSMKGGTMKVKITRVQRKY